MNYKSGSIRELRTFFALTLGLTYLVSGVMMLALVLNAA